MRSESREPDAGFIDNCSELHQTICPIEEEVDKSGSSFLIAFNQGKSGAGPFATRGLTTSCLPLSRVRQRLIGKWKCFCCTKLFGTRQSSGVQLQAGCWSLEMEWSNCRVSTVRGWEKVSKQQILLV